MKLKDNSGLLQLWLIFFVVLAIISFSYDNIVLTKVIAVKNKHALGQVVNKPTLRMDCLNHLFGGKTKSEHTCNVGDHRAGKL